MKYTKPNKTIKTKDIIKLTKTKKYKMKKMKKMKGGGDRSDDHDNITLNEQLTEKINYINTTTNTPNFIFNFLIHDKIIHLIKNKDIDRLKKIYYTINEDNNILKDIICIFIKILSLDESSCQTPTGISQIDENNYILLIKIYVKKIDDASITSLTNNFTSNRHIQEHNIREITEIINMFTIT